MQSAECALLSLSPNVSLVVVAEWSGVRRGCSRMLIECCKAIPDRVGGMVPLGSYPLASVFV